MYRARLNLISGNDLGRPSKAGHTILSAGRCLSIPPLSAFSLLTSVQSFIFLIISLEFGAYVLTRQVVNVFEWLVAWRGHKRNLRRRLRDAKTYEEWKTAAKELDDYLGFDEWKETEEDSYFDYALVSRSEPHRTWSLIGPLVGEESEKNTD